MQNNTFFEKYFSVKGRLPRFVFFKRINILGLIVVFLWLTFTLVAPSIFLLFYPQNDDSFFLNLVDSINPNQEPYDTLDDYNIELHITKHLKAKKELYARYVQRLSNANSEATIAYRDYFDYVSKNLKINDNYNFIPNLLLSPEHKPYEKLQKFGWVPTRLGMIKNPTHETRTIIPPFEI